MPGVELLFGPLVIGLVLSNILYGVMAIQMFLYFQTFKKDAAYIRYLVLYLFFVETASVVFQVAIIYEPLILRYATERAVIISPKMLPADAVSIVMVSTPIQLFTAWRISIITGSILFPILISILSIASFAGGMLVTIFVTIRPEYHQFQSFSTQVITWLASSAACDILITVILTYSLWSRKTGLAVDSQVNRIIRLTVQTGAITAIAAVMDFAIFLSFPQTTLQFIPDFSLSRLYSISLLSTLNARHRGRSDVSRVPNALFKDSTTVRSGNRSMPSQLSSMAYARDMSSTYESRPKLPNEGDLNDTQMVDMRSSLHVGAPRVRVDKSHV
ncbi:hypothetical protein C8J57DRAFT_307099 [Mycena rebaudengoi]|nr:hypothetical protein C8J57DRAFT_307099 [Mycena rebaudengoi]